MNLKNIFMVAKKDLISEFHTKQTLTFMVLFSILSIMIFDKAVGDYIQTVPNIGPGILWLVFLFTGMLGLGRAFIKEKEQGTFDGLKLLPISSEEILAGKTLFNFLLMAFIQIIAFPIFIGIFGFSDVSPILLIQAFLYLLLANLGFVMVTSSLSILVMNARAKELLLPIIILPILFPLISISIPGLSAILIDGVGLYGIKYEITVILAYIGVMAIVSMFTAEFTIEE